jgi:hypothetical protein
MKMLSRIYAVFGWLIVAIGILHMLATFRLSTGSALGKVWFFGSGLAIALVGALNLLNRTYGRSTFGIRVVCRAANVLMTLLAIVAGVVTGASLPQRLLVWSLLGCALILSCLPTQRIASQA